MYHAGKRRKSRRKLIAGLVLVSLLLIVAIIWFVNHLKSHTTLGPTPKAVITQISDRPKTKLFDEGLFTLQLPTDWQLVNHTTAGYNQYNWHNTVDQKGVRQLTIFVDTIPAKFAVNHFLAVEAAGNKVQQLSDVSDNCANFTQATSESKATGIALSKWNNLQFLCDVGSYNRDVIGTGSKDGLNTVTLTGSTKGRHKFLFTYTDNSPQPDYNIFLRALNSFELK